MRVPILPIVLSLSLLSTSSFAQSPADGVWRNATLFTADAHGTIAQAIAIRDGLIVYVGSNDGVAPFIGPSTKVNDLDGHFLMPGLIDGHMHPLEAGLKLRKCSLDYEPLTVPQLQERIQVCLDKTKNQEPDGWLEVVSWFQESMRPAGVKTSRATLDALKKLDFDLVLPGHGTPFRDKAHITAFQSYLTDVTAQVTKLRQQGVSPEDAAQRVDLTAHAKDFPQIRAPGADPRGVRRIYQWLDER